VYDDSKPMIMQGTLRNQKMKDDSNMTLYHNSLMSNALAIFTS
jgi:hypothetical protein